MKSIFLLFCLTIVSVGNNALSQKDTVYRFLTAGFSMESKVDAGLIAEKRWGIETWVVGGCIISEELEDSIVRCSKITDSLLRLEYGANWEKDYRNEVDVLDSLMTRVSSILIHMDFLKDKIESMNLDYGSLMFIPETSKRKDWTTVYVLYKSDQKNNKHWHQLYKLEMQLKEIRIKAKDDKDKVLQGLPIVYK